MVDEPPEPARFQRLPHPSRRGLTVLAVLLAAALVATGAWFWFGGGSTSATSAPRTVTVTHGTVEQSVSATGTIAPAVESDLSFQASGTVTSVPVTVGEKVAAGQTLATIDPSALQEQVTLAQASVTAAQSAVSAASTSASSASAQAQLASAQGKLASAQQELAAATLTSPIAGTVAAVSVQVGSQVGSSAAASSASSTISGTGSAGGSGAAGSSGARSSGASGSSAGAASTSSTSAAVVVIDTSSWVVDALVASSDLGSLKPGMQAQVTPNGSRSPLFGTVQSIGLIATSSASGTSEFPVTIALTGAQTGLYAGTAASVQIITEQLDNVLTVPTMAISTNGTRSTVTVQQGDGSDKTVAVTVGRLFGGQTEITKGLADGDKVVLPSFARSSTGSSAPGQGSLFGGPGGRGSFGGGNRSGGGAGGGQGSGGQGSGGQGSGQGSGSGSGGQGVAR